MRSKLDFLTIATLDVFQQHSCPALTPSSQASIRGRWLSSALGVSSRIGRRELSNIAPVLPSWTVSAVLTLSLHALRLCRSLPCPRSL